MPAAVLNKVSEQKQQTVADILTALFGTPDVPFLDAELQQSLDLVKIRRAAGPVSSDVNGKKVGLYREHCAHCHGVGGDGMGSLATFLNPYPRDYRPGLFKFKSTPSNLPNRPTHDDLLRVLTLGIEGTSMPSFRLLPRQDLEALVEYVKYLSIRGETELTIYRAIAEEYSDEKDTIPLERELLAGWAMEVVNKWNNAPMEVIKPVSPPADFGSPASLAKGKDLFYSDTKANCVKCHGTTALGDGQLEVVDDWSKGIDEALKLAGDDSAKVELIRDYSLPVRLNQPRNLIRGFYRGGRRPLDIYYRVHTGIQGSGMPGVEDTTVSPEDKWHVVAYVLSLPYAPGGLLGADKDVIKESNQSY